MFKYELGSCYQIPNMLDPSYEAIMVKTHVATHLPSCRIFLQVLSSEWRHHVCVEGTVQQSQLLEGDDSQTQQSQYSSRVVPQQVAVGVAIEGSCSVHLFELIT